jgi:hypothetical protein
MFHKIVFFLAVGCSFFRALVGQASPAIVGDLFAELGNQFFVVAAASSLAWDHGAEAYFPDFNSNQFHLKENYHLFFWRVNKSSPQVPINFYYQEPTHTFSPIPYQPNMQLHGYFQSEKYFRHNKEKILQLFEPKKEIINAIKKKYDYLFTSKMTVSIHVRTYCRPVHDTQNLWPLNGREYVAKAMQYFPPEAVFIVCSDNIQWCKENLADLAMNMYFVEGETYYTDFYLMSLCSHNIISNSSFSWWAAYLNKNKEKIVIAPECWFGDKIPLDSKDLIPDEWITISK